MKDTEYYGLLNATWRKFYNTRDEILQKPSSRKSSVEQDRYCKSFHKVLKLCLEKDIDPLDYVEKVFDILIKQHKYILPCDIAKPNLIERYIEVYGEPEPTLTPEERWNNQVKLMTTLSIKLIPEIYTCEDEILIDPARPFEPWFRVFYANGMKDLIIRRWGEYACEQLRDRNLWKFCSEMFGEDCARLELQFNER